MDAAHEVVLSRRDRDPVFRRIDAVFQAAFIDMWEMMLNDVFAENGHIEPDKRTVIFLHLFADFCRHQIAGQDFIGKTLAILAAQFSPFAADRFGNEEAPAGLLRIKRRRMDLDVVDVFQFDAVAHGDSQGIAREMGEIRRMVVQAADTAAGQDRFIGLDGPVLALAVAGNDAQAAVPIGDDVDHGREIANGHIGQLTDSG